MSVDPRMTGLKLAPGQKSLRTWAAELTSANPPCAGAGRVKAQRPDCWDRRGNPTTRTWGLLKGRANMRGE
jgi:hypothetical protein